MIDIDKQKYLDLLKAEGAKKETLEYCLKLDAESARDLYAIGQTSPNPAFRPEIWNDIVVACKMTKRLPSLNDPHWLALAYTGMFSKYLEDFPNKLEAVFKQANADSGELISKYSEYQNGILDQVKQEADGRQQQVKNELKALSDTSTNVARDIADDIKGMPAYLSGEVSKALQKETPKIVAAIDGLACQADGLVKAIEEADDKRVEELEKSLNKLKDTIAKAYAEKFEENINVANGQVVLFGTNVSSMNRDMNEANQELKTLRQELKKVSDTAKMQQEEFATQTIDHLKLVRGRIVATHGLFSMKTAIVGLVMASLGMVSGIYGYAKIKENHSVYANNQELMDTVRNTIKAGQATFKDKELERMILERKQ